MKSRNADTETSTERTQCANIWELDGHVTKVTHLSQEMPRIDDKHQKLGKSKEDFPYMFQGEHGSGNTLILDF